MNLNIGPPASAGSHPYFSIETRENCSSETGLGT